MANVVVGSEARNRLGVIWAGMLTAIASYGAVCAVVISPEPGTDSDTETLRYTFTGAGILLGALSAWWRRRFLAIDAPTPLTTAQLQTHSIVVWALSDAVALCGLVLAFISHAVSEFFPFGLAAGGLMLLHRPAALPFDRVRSTVA